MHQKLSNNQVETIWFQLQREGLTHFCTFCTEANKDGQHCESVQMHQQ
jgi:hypothetical protein